MSVSALPEWKQLLLERKRRDEEDRERREKEEELRLANMPAWKREIIQRRRAKQDEEREREGGLDYDNKESGLTPSRPQNGLRVREDQKTESPTKSRTGEEEKSGNAPSLTGGLRTIQANNIIIIEKDKSREEEEKTMTMDLRGFLAGGGSVTEIRASEVLIIKPPPDGGSSSEKDGARELDQTRVPTKNFSERRLECGGRVSQLLSRFGECPKPPMRSKSTDCFQPGPGAAQSGLEEEEDAVEPDTTRTSRGVPKRSFSFSDRTASHQNSAGPDLQLRVLERRFSERGVRSEGTVSRRLARARPEEKDWNENSTSAKVPDGSPILQQTTIRKKISPGRQEERTDDGWHHAEHFQSLYSCARTCSSGSECQTDTPGDLTSCSDSSQRHCNAQEMHMTVDVPRTVFYGVDVSVNRRRVSLPVGESGGRAAGEAERRGSWRSGRPLTRVESLKERMRKERAQRRPSEEEPEETQSWSLRLCDITQKVSVVTRLPVPVSLSTETAIGLMREPCADEDEAFEKDHLPPFLSPSPPPSDPLGVTMSHAYSPKCGAQGSYQPLRHIPTPDVLPESWNQVRGDGDAGTVSLVEVKVVQKAEGQKRPDVLRETPRLRAQLHGFGSSHSAESSAFSSPSSPSLPLFSIRSASAGPGRHGTTITVTPRRSPRSESAPDPTCQDQTPSAAILGRRRLPTAEEIQVIGGYQSLQRSCLPKSRGTGRPVKVCFDEARLERVCEYPSEDSLPLSLSGWDELRAEEEEDEEEEDSGGGRVRLLRVDESCRRL